MMADYRVIPKDLFTQPAIMALHSRDHEHILIDLILHADDEGRGYAHSELLARLTGYQPEQIEEALLNLAQNEVILLYEEGRYRYFFICQWFVWQKGMRHIIASKHPAPPPSPTCTTSPHNVEMCDNAPKSSENFGKDAPEGEGEEKRREENQNRREEEGEEGIPSNVVQFPIVHSTTTTISALSIDAKKVVNATHQVAEVLKLPITDALRRLVAEYLDEPTISLLGEADAAREYIDDTRRNQKGQHMSPAFFRRWLKREKGEMQQAAQMRRGMSERGSGSDKYQARDAHTGTYGAYGTHDRSQAKQTRARDRPKRPEATNEGSDDPYRAYVQQRSQALQDGTNRPAAEEGEP